MNILKNIRKFSILPLNEKNELLPLCINCQYFIKAETNYPDDSFPDDKNGKCKNSGIINLVTGKIEYNYASYCRNDDEKTFYNTNNLRKCGKNGIYFLEK